jgi:repressor LexA
VQPLTKRQREILDYLNEFIQHHGYAPSLEEIGRRFSLSSLATVHKHLKNLEDKGCIKRVWNKSRSVELLATRTGTRTAEIPLLGRISAGVPIQTIPSDESVSVPEEFIGIRDAYALRVHGNSMMDEQIRDGDIVIIEDRKKPHNGETVIALLDGSNVVLKAFFLENNNIRLQPSNPTLSPLLLKPESVYVQGIVVAVMRRY